MNKSRYCSFGCKAALIIIIEEDDGEMCNIADSTYNGKNLYVYIFHTIKTSSGEYVRCTPCKSLFS